MPADYLSADLSVEQEKSSSIHGEKEAAQIALTEHDSDAHLSVDGVQTTIHSLWSDQEVPGLCSIHTELDGSIHDEASKEYDSRPKGDIPADHVLSVADAAPDFLPTAPSTDSAPDRSKIS